MGRGVFIAVCLIASQSISYAQLAPAGPTGSSIGGLGIPSGSRPAPADLGGTLRKGLRRGLDQSERPLTIDAINKLSTLEAQKQFVDIAGALPTSDTNRGIANAISAWTTHESGRAVPTSALTLLIDRGLNRTPSNSDATRSELINLRIPRGMDRHEVEPDVGADTIRRGYGNKPAPPETLGALAASDERDRQRVCGDAVRKLRAKVKIDGAESDRIFGFDQVCLFSDNKRNPPPLTTLQRKYSLECAAAYQDYRKYCLTSGDVNQLRAKIANVVGILAIKEAAENGSINQSIACSATLLGPRLALTARHCLSSLLDKPLQRVSIIFKLLGSQKDLEIEGVRFPAGNKTVSIPEALEQHKAWVEQRDLNADYVLLILASPGAIEREQAEFPSLQKPEPFKPVVLTGFQRLIANAMKLQARLGDKSLFDDNELIENGDWRKAFGFDASPTCQLIRLTEADAAPHNIDVDRVYGNFCQSLNSSSGGGLLSIPSDNSASIAITGLVSRSILDFDLLAAGQRVESFRPNNAAVVVTTQILDDIRSAQN